MSSGPGKARNERGSERAAALGILMFWAAASVWMFARAMSQPFSHDENQFVAAGALIAREGMLPYRDFPLHHTPYQPAIFSLLFLVSDHLLLVSRVFASFSGALALGLLLFLSWRAFRAKGQRMAALATVGAGVLFVTNPIVAYTSGRAWNHDVPLLFALCAFTLRCLADDRGGRLRWLVASGIFCGLATGARLSFVALAIPLLLSALAVPVAGSPKGWPRNVGAMASGIALGLLPVAVLAVSSPSGFYFGNVVYQVLNSVYRELLLHWLGNALRGKFIYLQEEILPNPVLVSLVFASVGMSLIAAVRSLRTGRRLPMGISLAVSFWLLLAAGSLAPTPIWYQYFYAPVPFLILALMMSVVALTDMGVPRSLPGAVLALTLVVAASAGANRLTVVGKLAVPHTWVPVEVHLAGEEIADLVGMGRVLTLAPIIPLEGDLKIYAEFAAGPFTWRVAHLLSSERREVYGVTSMEDLAAFLETDPPAAIAVGFEAKNEGFVRGEEGGVEDPLTTYAKQNGYTPIPLDMDFAPETVILWIRD